MLLCAHTYKCDFEIVFWSFKKSGEFFFITLPLAVLENVKMNGMPAKQCVQAHFEMLYLFCYMLSKFCCNLARNIKNKKKSFQFVYLNNLPNSQKSYVVSRSFIFFHRHLYFYRSFL